MAKHFQKDTMFYKFCAYGFLKNLNFYEPFMMLFLLEKGFSFLQIGSLYSVQFVATNILQIPTGLFADSVGRRRTMMIAFVSYIISFVLFFTSKTYLPLMAAMLFFSFGESFRSGTHKAMIFQYLKIKGWQDQKVHYYGHTRSWSQTGSAISALIAAGIVVFSGTYSYVFLASIVPYIVDLLLIMSYPVELDGQIKKIRFSTLGANLVSVVKEFFSSFINLSVLKAVSNTAIYSGYYDALKHYLQPVIKTFALTLPVFIYLDDKKRSAILIGAVYFLLYIQTAYFARISGRIADRFRHLSIPLNITLVTGLVIGLLSGLCYHYEYLVAAILLYVGVYTTQNLRKPMGEAFIADMVDHSILATALSAEDQVATLTAALFAPILGFVADQFGIGYALAALSLGLLFLSPLLLVRSKK